MTRFLMVYLFLAVAGQMVLTLDAIKPVIAAFCLGLAQVCWCLIQLVDSGVTLTGAILRHGQDGFALEVTEVCSGLPTAWLLCAAVLSSSVPWRTKVWAAPTALAVVQTMNIVRLISLVYAGQGLDRTTFDVIHEIAWPLLFQVWAILWFLAWCFWVWPRIRDENATA